MSRIARDMDDNELFAENKCSCYLFIVLLYPQMERIESYACGKLNNANVQSTCLIILSRKTGLTLKTPSNG
jgi:hypothetical protein